jgi:LytR cell envelope-related transcriptional attenuator
MTDFISELEAELVAAARRRAAAPQRRRPRVSLPRLRPAPVAAAAGVAAIAAAAVLVVANIGETGPGDERAVPPASTGAALILPAAVPAADCQERDTRVMAGPVPDISLSVLSREREPAADNLPDLAGEWLPATTIWPGESRRAGDDVHLVPADGIRADGACVPPDEHDGGTGVCLVVRETGVLVRCFDTATIAAGRAVALTGRDRVHGIAPDGVKHLKLAWSGGAADADVTDNVYAAHTPGLEEGDAVRVIVQRPSQGCVPSRELLAAVPALAAASGDEPPPAVAEAMTREGARGAWRRWARLARDGDDFEVWVAPNMPCDNPRKREEEACLVAIRPDEASGVLCVWPGETGSSLVVPGAERVTIAGFAPPGAGTLTVTRPGRATLETTAVGGVFGMVLPEPFGTTGDGIDVMFGVPDVAILNATPQKGLATATGELLPGVELIGNYISEERERSTVFYSAEEARHEAEEIARRLRIADVQPAPPDDAGLADGARVIVVLGRDRLP